MARKFNLMTGKWDEIANTSGSAGSTATFITVSAEPTLPNSRRLAVSGDLTLTDGGPGGTITVGHTASSGTVTSVAGGVGITNTPEPITTTGTVDLDINSLTTETVVDSGDLFPFVDVSVGTSPSSQRKVTLTDLRTGVNIDGDPLYFSYDQYQGAGGGGVGGSTAIIVVGHSASSTTSSVSAGFQDSTGAYVDLSSTAGIADSNATYAGPTDHMATILNPTFGFVFKTGTDITTQRAWFVFASATPYAADDPAGLHIVGFRYAANSPAAGVNDTTWQCATKDGTTLGLTNSGVTVVANTRYVFRVVCTATSALFYINNVLVATRATNLPTSTTGLAFFSGLRARGTGARTFRFRKTWLRQT